MKKVTGANGYEVSRSVKKNGKYTTIKRVSSKTISYTQKKLTKNRTYYFRVRAYKIVNGKKIYSGWSRVKSVRVKRYSVC